MAANPYEKLPKVLEDAFIKVSFEDDDGSATSTHKAYDEWIKNASADRVSTDEYSHALFKKAYPNHTLVVAEGIDILNIPMVDVEPMFPEQMITANFFYALARREAVPGVVLQQIKFGAFRVQFEAQKFIVYIATYSKIYGASYPQPVHFILSESGSEDPAKELILTAGVWANTLHNEILVFQDGYWRKDSALWSELQKADWKDVILDADRKAEIRKDVYGFFKSEQIYKDLGIPWKRGLIMYGPPGNGKTISIKAIMKECFDKGFTPMYVKSFKFWGGEEAAMQNCFSGARRESPCVLIIEDLDSLITSDNRSFFLNQLDGFEGNDGILCVGTTNHLDRLDPALSNRPSRFDKHYFFGDPNRDERVLYVRYWQRKLKGNKSISFPDSLVEEVADSTDKFSFAYLKEAFVSTLFKLATQDETDELEFESLLKQTIKGLRKALDDGAPKDFQPRTEPQQQLPFIAKEELEKYSRQLKEQNQVQDLAARASAALRLGRRFIY